MFVYWAIFLVLGAGAFFSREERAHRSRLTLVLLAALPTLLMIGLRWKIGPDWPAYFLIFNYTKFWSLSQMVSHPDPGFYLLTWVLHRLGAPFWVENLLCGTVFITGLTAFSMRQPNPWLAYLAAFPYLVIVIAMSADRQTVALGLLFFAFNAFEQARLGRFSVLVIIAALFHGSVLLIAPLCFLSYTRNRLQQTVLLIVVVALGYYFFRETFSTYASRYSTDKVQSSGAIYRLGMNAFSALLFLGLGKRFAVEEHQARLWRNISLFSLALVGLLFVLPSSTAIDRFLLYLFPLQSFVLSRIPKAIAPAGASVRFGILLVIAYAAVVQVTFLQFGRFAGSYVPYRTIFAR